MGRFLTLGDMESGVNISTPEDGRGGHCSYSGCQEFGHLYNKLGGHCTVVRCLDFGHLGIEEGSEVSIFQTPGDERGSHCIVGVKIIDI